MKLKDVFKRKKTEENKEVDVPMVEKALLDEQKDELLDVPKVVFENLELQVTVGQWLGILSSSQSFGNLAITVYTHLSAEELMKKTNIPAKKFEEIVTKFGLLLKLAGINNEETCTLSQFDKDKFSFNCRFNNSGIDAKISLRWGNMIDFGPEFIIDYQNENKTYEYYPEYEENPARLKLEHYTINNPENGNACHRYFSPYSASFILTNGEHSFSIKIERPESIKADIFSDYVFKLENEEQLQQYLLGLSFPLEITEVYKKICEISTNSVVEYPNFNIETKIRIDKRNSKKTNLISLKHGALSQFIITKNEKTISIDSNGNWSYDTPKMNITQNDEGNINYSLNSIHNNELLSVASPSIHYNEACQEVEEIRKLTKTVLESKEN